MGGGGGIQIRSQTGNMIVSQQSFKVLPKFDDSQSLYIMSVLHVFCSQGMRPGECSQGTRPGECSQGRRPAECLHVTWQATSFMKKPITIHKNKVKYTICTYKGEPPSAITNVFTTTLNALVAMETAWFEPDAPKWYKTVVDCSA